MKEQIEKIRKVYVTGGKLGEFERISLIMICRENTTMTMREIRNHFNNGSTLISNLTKVLKASDNEDFMDFHQKKVEKLKQIGFRFV